VTLHASWLGEILVVEEQNTRERERNRGKDEILTICFEWILEACNWVG
jgi:hypothetical protein